MNRHFSEKGFGMSVAIMSLSLGTLAIVLVADEAALAYSGSVEARHMRVQHQLDAAACNDTASIIRAKDVFASGIIELPEFHCELSL